MRVNAVIMMIIDGAKDKMVNINNICRLSATSCGLLAGSTPMFTLGIGISGAASEIDIPHRISKHPVSGIIRFQVKA